MRLILPTIAAILAFSGAVHAQSLGGPPAMGAPAMGATSPLGIPGATSMPAQPAIPLGATEIDSGGLSPMPLATCPTLPSGTFDGGGLTGCTATNSPLAGGSAPPLPTPGSVPTLSGANIPLGATQTTNAGLSPPIIVPSTVPGTTIGMPTTTTMTMPSIQGQ